jgi:hypothetical protein
MVESLARFNNLTQEVEREKRASTRPYIFMPYFAALLLVDHVRSGILQLTMGVSILGPRVYTVGGYDCAAAQTSGPAK